MPGYARSGGQKKEKRQNTQPLSDDKTSVLPFVRHPVAVSALRPRCLYCYYYIYIYCYIGILNIAIVYGYMYVYIYK